MIAYVTLGTNNIDRSSIFYDKIFSMFNASRVIDKDFVIAWGCAKDKPLFTIIKPFNEKMATVGNGVMVSLFAENREKVDKVHSRALSLGAQNEGFPGQRKDRYYAAYFRDLDGNKLNVICFS